MLERKGSRPKSFSSSGILAKFSMASISLVLIYYVYRKLIYFIDSCLAEPPAYLNMKILYIYCISFSPQQQCSIVKLGPFVPVLLVGDHVVAIHILELIAYLLDRHPLLVQAINFVFDLGVQVGLSSHQTNAVVVASAGHLHAVQTPHYSVQEMEFVLLVGIPSECHLIIIYQSYIKLVHLANDAPHFLIKAFSLDYLLLQILVTSQVEAFRLHQMEGPSKIHSPPGLLLKLPRSLLNQIFKLRVKQQLLLLAFFEHLKFFFSTLNLLLETFDGQLSLFGCCGVRYQLLLVFFQFFFFLQASRPQLLNLFVFFVELLRSFLIGLYPVLAKFILFEAQYTTTVDLLLEASIGRCERFDP